MRPDVVTDPPPSASVGDPDELVSELQATLERAGSLIRALRDRRPREPAPAGTDPGAERLAELKGRLEVAESDLREISERLVDTEHQRGRLMTLYVATYQLHATLDMDEVQATIGEIAHDLLGARSFVLLLRAGEDEACEIALAEGLDEVTGGLFAAERYTGGDLSVDRTLDDGLLRIAREEGSAALAVVPLIVQGVTVGALVLLDLYEHKPSLTAEDRDLLDLLAAHAASALFAARVYSATDRKLRTLESLVKLVRGG